MVDLAVLFSKLVEVEVALVLALVDEVVGDLDGCIRVEDSFFVLVNLG